MLSVGLKKNNILADHHSINRINGHKPKFENKTLVKVGVSDFGLEGNYTQSASPARDLETNTVSSSINNNPRDLDISLKNGDVKISSTKEVKETNEKKTFFTPVVMVVGGLVIIAAGIYLLG